MVSCYIKGYWSCHLTQQAWKMCWPAAWLLPACWPPAQQLHRIISLPLNVQIRLSVYLKDLHRCHFLLFNQIYNNKYITRITTSSIKAELVKPDSLGHNIYKYVYCTIELCKALFQSFLAYVNMCYHHRNHHCNTQIRIFLNSKAQFKINI